MVGRAGGVKSGRGTRVDACHVGTNGDVPMYVELKFNVPRCVCVILHATVVFWHQLTCVFATIDTRTEKITRDWFSHERVIEMLRYRSEARYECLRR